MFSVHLQDIKYLRFFTSLSLDLSFPFFPLLFPLYSFYVSSSSSILRVLRFFSFCCLCFSFLLSFIHSLMLLNVLLFLTSWHLTVTWCVPFLFKYSTSPLTVHCRFVSCAVQQTLQGRFLCRHNLNLAAFSSRTVILLGSLLGFFNGIKKFPTII